ncbi:MAG: serine/threonine-protein kinase [Gemmataceae bacterium]|nr:serine/threonine-protein kinase [Gemmataceae bacterium]
MPPTAPPQFETRQRIASHSDTWYQIIQKLGQGGNSHVYLVLALSGQYRGLLFALKLFVKVTDATRLNRFKREVEFLRKFSHPAIMRIYDEGEVVTSGLSQVTFPFVIAEYLPSTLHDAMLSGLTMTEKLSYVMQLLSALLYLDSQTPKIIHRDIKPENIFIRGRASILGDFGLMKLIDLGSERTEASDDKGFVIESTGPRLPRFYRSPDLVDYCRGKSDLTTKSDVFQLGLVFTTMFTGSNPLKPCAKILDPVELDSIQTFLGSQSSAICSLLKTMLGIDPLTRPSPEALLDSWEGIYREVISLSLSLEGRVF